jgi:hypothetical protein
LEFDELHDGELHVPVNKDEEAVIYNIIGEFERHKQRFNVRIFYIRPMLVFAYMENNDEFMMDALMGSLLLDHEISIDQYHIDIGKIENGSRSSVIIDGSPPASGKGENSILEVEWVEKKMYIASFGRETTIRAWGKGWIDVKMVPSDVIFTDVNKYMSFPLELLVFVIPELIK